MLVREKCGEFMYVGKCAVRWRYVYKGQQAYVCSRLNLQPRNQLEILECWSAFLNFVDMNACGPGCSHIILNIIRKVTKCKSSWCLCVHIIMQQNISQYEKTCCRIRYSLGLFSSMGISDISSSSLGIQDLLISPFSLKLQI